MATRLTYTIMNSKFKFKMVQARFSKIIRFVLLDSSVGKNIPRRTRSWKLRVFTSCLSKVLLPYGSPSFLRKTGTKPFSFFDRAGFCSNHVTTWNAATISAGEYRWCRRGKRRSPWCAPFGVEVWGSAVSFCLPTARQSNSIIF